MMLAFKCELFLLLGRGISIKNIIKCCLSEKLGPLGGIPMDALDVWLCSSHGS